MDLAGGLRVASRILLPRLAGPAIFNRGMGDIHSAPLFYASAHLRRRWMSRDALRGAIFRGVTPYALCVLAAWATYSMVCAW